MKSTGHLQARRLVFGLSVLTAAAAVTAQVVEGPPGGGYGWGAVAVGSALIAVPVLVIGFLVLGGAPRAALAAVIVAALVVAIVVLALAGNWAEQSSTARAMDTAVAALVLIVAAGTVGLEAPLLRRTRV